MYQELDRATVDTVYRTLRYEGARLTRNPADAEDAVQNAWVLLFDKLASGCDPTSLPAFARTLCRNDFVDHIRKQVAEREAFASIAPEGLMSEEVEAPALRQAYDDDVLSLAIRLPPRQRPAQILRKEGKPLAEIAEFMKISIGTVKATLSAGRKTMEGWAIELRKQYDDADEPPPEEWPAAMRIMTRADKEDLVRQIEDRHGPMSAADRAEIIEPPPLVDIPHVPVKRRRHRQLAKRDQRSRRGSDQKIGR